MSYLGSDHLFCRHFGENSASGRQTNLDGRQDANGINSSIDGIEELDNVLDQNDVDATGHHVLTPGGVVHISGNETRIDVSDIKRKVLAPFVTFIKTDRIGNASGIAMDFFMLGNRYQVALLKKVAGKFMTTYANEEA